MLRTAFVCLTYIMASAAPLFCTPKLCKKANEEIDMTPAHEVGALQKFLSTTSPIDDCLHLLSFHSPLHLPQNWPCPWLLQSVACLPAVASLTALALQPLFWLSLEPAQQNGTALCLRILYNGFFSLPGHAELFLSDFTLYISRSRSKGSGSYKAIKQYTWTTTQYTGHGLALCC